jgi:hypothetical protein
MTVSWSLHYYYGEKIASRRSEATAYIGWRFAPKQALAQSVVNAPLITGAAK